MKRRWKALIAVSAIATGTVLVPVIYIEGFCRAPLPGFSASDDYISLLPAADRRAEGRTWLTYPEWHIVYEAESFARHLKRGAPPSSFAYGQQIRSFWSSYCTLNRVTRGSPAGSEAKVMIYTIGISYTAELAFKAAYENTLGRLTEAIGGWRSADDRYAAKVQARYGAFMHETPWYRFPFGAALTGAWQTDQSGSFVRHWERRLAATAEYGFKAGYAKLIGAASGATLGRDETRLRFVASARPELFQSIDTRLKPVAALPGDMTVVEAPRYAQFSELLAKMARRDLSLVEIAGNDDIFLTVLLPHGAALPAGSRRLIDMPIERGRRRVGVSVKVPQLLPFIRALDASRGELEHVYDY